VIGIYDSGLGGLSVWRELRHYVKAPLLYFGDTCHVPYGEKTPEELEGYFWDIVGFFQKQGCAAVVVACNTSSALVLPRVRDKVQLQVPVFGIIESAVSAALAVTDGRVGVLATRGTVESGAYQEAFRRVSSGIKVFAQSAPRLVPLVEQGQTRSRETRTALQEYLARLLAEGIDTLLLGCTHYPFLEELIGEVAGATLRIVNPAPAMARQIAEALPNLSKRAAEPGCRSQFWVSGDPHAFQITAELLLGESLPAVGLHTMSGENT
jgi:glutamate racemase